MRMDRFRLDRGRIDTMNKETATLSDLQEVEWTQSVGTIVTGLSLVVGSALLLYFSKFWLSDSPLMMARALMSLALVVGVGVTGLGAFRFIKARSVSSVAYPCPYCNAECRLANAPTDNFVCEGCSRTVHFLDGEPVEVVEVTCSACRSAHKVCISASRYICDKCNRPVNLPFLKDDHSEQEFDQGGLTQNYDVLLFGYDHRKENELAFKLQNVMMVNLAETKRLLHAVTPESPLVVGNLLAERKADSIKRQLQELGATVSTRASAAVAGRPA